MHNNINITPKRRRFLEIDGIDIDSVVDAVHAGFNAPAATVATPEPEYAWAKVDVVDTTPVPMRPAPTTEQLATDRLARVTEDRDAASAAGFAIAKTVYELGTLVNETGVANLKKSRDDFDALPSVSDGLRQLGSDIAAEKRRDRVASIRDLVYTNDGRLGRRGANPSNAATFTSSSFTDLTSRLDIPTTAAKFLRRSQPLSASAAIINHRIGEMGDDQVLVRARDSKSGDGRNVFAVLSPKYTPIDLSDIAGKLLDVKAFKDAKIDVSYDWETTQAILDITFHTDTDAGNAACGEYFKAGVRLKTADNGGCSLSASSYLVRNLCLNFIILDEAEIKLDRIVHRGSLDSRLDRLVAAVSKGSASIEHFATKWTAASSQVIDTPAIPSKVVEEIKAWADCTTEERVAGLVNGYAKQTGFQLSQQQVGVIASAYGRDALTGGDTITKAGVINAITRSAHEDMSRWTGDALERWAGSLTWNQAIQPQFQYVSVVR